MGGIFIVVNGFGQQFVHDVRTLYLADIVATSTVGGRGQRREYHGARLGLGDWFRGLQEDIDLFSVAFDDARHMVIGTRVYTELGQRLVAIALDDTWLTIGQHIQAIGNRV